MADCSDYEEDVVESSTSSSEKKSSEQQDLAEIIQKYDNMSTETPAKASKRKEDPKVTPKSVSEKSEEKQSSDIAKKPKTVQKTKPDSTAPRSKPGETIEIDFKRRLQLFTFDDIKNSPFYMRKNDRTLVVDKTMKPAEYVREGQLLGQENVDGRWKEVEFMTLDSFFVLLTRKKNKNDLIKTTIAAIQEFYQRHKLSTPKGAAVDFKRVSKSKNHRSKSSSFIDDEAMEGNAEDIEQEEEESMEAARRDEDLAEEEGSESEEEEEGEDGDDASVQSDYSGRGIVIRKRRFEANDSLTPSKRAKNNQGGSFQVPATLPLFDHEYIQELMDQRATDEQRDTFQKECAKYFYRVCKLLTQVASQPVTHSYYSSKRK